MTHISRWIVGLSILLISLSITAPLAAQDSDREALIAAVIAVVEPETIQSLDAPDGSQRAEVTVYPCVAIGEETVSYERLDMINTDTGAPQLIADQVINCGGLGAFGLWAQRWSEDGAFLYYTEAREGTPDGLSAGWSPPLWRVHLADMQVESLGQAAFSPDGAWVALWDWEHICLMPPAATEPTCVDWLYIDIPVAEVMWLPDSSGLLIIQADSLFGSATRSIVAHLDVMTTTQTVLLDTGSE